MINTYDIDDKVILVAKFRDRYGAPLACVVTGAIRQPNEAGTTDVLNFAATTEVGTYEAVYNPPIAGKYWWRAKGAGAVGTAGERAFTVRKEKVIIP